MSLSAEKQELLKRLLQKKGIGASPQNQISPRGESEPPVASFLQEGLWFLDQLDPGKATYNVPGATRIRGQLDVSALQRTFTEMVKRHESLRTTFVHENGRPLQVIAAPQPFDLQVVELGDLPEDQRMDEALRLATEEARRPFDLEKGPLFRAFLIRLNEDEHVLVLNIHHIVTDGWSMGVFTRDLLSLYEAFVKGEAPPLRELPIQFSDFAVWQRNWLRGERLESQLSYWRRKLVAPLPVLDFPTDYPRPKFQSSRGEHQTIMLPQPLSDALRMLTQREDYTLFETLLTAYKIFLHFVSDQTDIIVGSPVANRNRKELENLIGYFVNMIPLRTELSGDPTFLELLERVHQTTMDGYAHQDLPFGKLVEELEIKRDPGRNPVFQTEFILLTYEHAPAVYGYGFRSPIKRAVEVANLTLTPLDVESGVSKFDVVVLLWDMEEGISGTFEYNADLFRPETIKRWIGLFEKVLHEIVAKPTARLSELQQSLARMRERQAETNQEERKKSKIQKLKKIRRKPAVTS